MHGMSALITTHTEKCIFEFAVAINVCYFLISMKVESLWQALDVFAAPACTEGQTCRWHQWMDALCLVHL